MKKVLLITVLAIFLSVSEASAQASWLWWPGAGIGIGGNEAARVMRANPAMICDLSNCWQNPYQYPSYPTTQQVVVTSSQVPVVCTPKPRGHQWKDVLGGAGLGAGIGLWTAGKRGAIGGAMAGAGGGTLVTNHEYDCRPVQQIQPQPLTQQQYQQPYQPQGQYQPSIGYVRPSAPIVVVEPEIAKVRFTVVNETQPPRTITTEGGWLVLRPRAKGIVVNPNPEVFIMEPDSTGAFQPVLVDLRGMEDPILPGWRIRQKP